MSKKTILNCQRKAQSLQSKFGDKASLVVEEIINAIESFNQIENASVGIVWWQTVKSYLQENKNLFDKDAVCGSFVNYQTFLIEGVNEMLKAEKSIVKDGFVRISIDEKYKCSNADLARYKIEYEYHLHLIHLGFDLHRAELKLSDELKRKWWLY